MAAVVSVARELPARRKNPIMNDADNPLFAEHSVYTDPRGRHCLVGEVLTRLRHPVPAWSDADNRTPWPTLQAHYDIEPEASELLGHLQSGADGGAAWGDVVGDWLAALADGEGAGPAGDSAPAAKCRACRGDRPYGHKLDCSLRAEDLAAALEADGGR